MQSKEFLQLHWLNVHERYLQFIVSYIFKFENDRCSDYFDELFCPVGENGVIVRYSNKKLKLPFQKTKVGIQSLSYVGTNTLNNLPDNLKSATNVNSSKHYKYFLKMLGKQNNDPKTKFGTFLEFMQNGISIVLPFSLFQYQDFFQSFLWMIFTILISIFHFSKRTTIEIKLCSFFVLSLSP